MSLRAALACLLLAGCSANRSMSGLPRACTSDNDCAEGQLCYAEGCGDPGKNVVVEVSGGSLTGLYARDFPIADGTLSRSTNFDLGQPLTVSGEFQRERTEIPNPTNRAVYAETVMLRAVGESELIPGITRTFEARFDSPERGRFQMNVGAGRFDVTAMPADRSVPPLQVSDVRVAPPSTNASVTFAFPAADGAPIIAGQLVKALTSTLVPGQPVPLTMSNVEVQLFDAVSRQPLSQRFPVASTTGEFQIAASPEAVTKTSLILVAGPREVGTPAPTKSFLLDNPLPTAAILEYGDFGEARPVKGRVVDQGGRPVAGAQLQLEGLVAGDGTFRSLVTVTDDEGAFSLDSLASRQAGSFTLSIAPPMASRTAYTRKTVTVTIREGEATLEPDVVTLDERLTVRGRVVTPDGRPAQGVGVRATIQEEQLSSLTTETRSLPREPAVATTDAEGTFELSLDPGIWRFDYYPGESLPLASRLITVKAKTDELGLALPSLDLPVVTLANGRRVTGEVTGVMGAKSGAPVPYSQLRFFRATWVEGRPSAILLGTAIADERGRYEVVLPNATR